MNIDDMNKAYEEALLGGEGKPSLAVVRCQFCGKAHILTGKDNQCCDAFRKWIIAHEPLS